MSTTSGRHLEQLERVRRYLERFRQLKAGRPHTMSSENYQDDVYSFFLNCYHLMDWIKCDPVCTAWKPRPWEFVDATPDLAICRDLCNSIKHLTLDPKRRRSGQDPKFAEVPVHVIVCDTFTEKEAVYLESTAVISTTSGLMDGYELAMRCVDAWERYIAANTGPLE